MQIIKSKIDKIIEWLLIGLLTLMVFNVSWQVFSRFIIGDPSSWTEELTRYSLIWLGMIGAGYVTGKKMHLAIDYFANKVKEPARGYIEIFIHTTVLLFALTVMVIGGTNLVGLTLYLEQISASLQIQLGYVYLALPISGILIIFYSTENIYEILKSKKG
ncbi:MAG: TRAP transporter small permease [Melioribacteraceae bacterium]|nr:TRAP transporter small permease [Melioribacteraceae bacterium]